MKIQQLPTALLIVAFASMTSADPVPEGNGKALYVERGCASCHGVDGDTPVLPLYPRLAGQDAQYLLQQMQDIASGARNNGLAMTMRVSAGDISESEWQAIAAYLATVDNSTAVAADLEIRQRFDDYNRAVITGGFAAAQTTTLDGGLTVDGDFRKGKLNKNTLPTDTLFYAESQLFSAVAEGMALYTAKGCLGCHGAEGRKPPIPGYPSVAGQSVRYAFKQMQDIRDGTRQNGQVSLMEAIVSGLSDDELKAIAGYLASLKP